MTFLFLIIFKMCFHEIFTFQKVCGHNLKIQDVITLIFCLLTIGSILRKGRTPSLKNFGQKVTVLRYKIFCEIQFCVYKIMDIWICII
jgi:hypothetical protein